MTEYIYHYTKFDGLNGILRDKNLWATNAFYSNDKSEIILGIQLLKTAIQNELGENKDYNFLEGFLYDERVVKGIFIISFSTIDELDDKEFIAKNGLLSQWRGYGNYAIKFKKNILNKSLANKEEVKGLIITANLDRKVNYLEEENIDKFKELFESELTEIKQFFFKKFPEILNKVRNNTANDDDWKYIGKIARNDFYNCGFFTKHKGFKEEHEVRIISTLPAESEDGYKKEIYFHAPKKSHIKLFSENEEIIREAIKEIVIGPMPSQDAAKKQLELMLKQYGFCDDVKITCSKIPFIQR